MDLTKFHPAQQEAIRHKDGPALVLAGPGSGKTTVLTKRLQMLIGRHHVPESSILVVTFTKAAALQMKERFEALTDHASAIYFGTFHSIFYHILRESSPQKSLKLITEKEKYEYLRRCMYKQGIPEEDYPFVRDEIGRLKNMGHIPKDYQPGLDDVKGEQLLNILTEYKEICARNEVLDFDDMAYDCYRMFLQSPKLLERWQKRFRYILIDEYQDINELQSHIMNLLAGCHRNIFMVGDDDQSIYGFRGSRSEIMLRLQETYHDLRMIRLEMNYRCHPGIIEAAVRVIGENRNRYEKKQVPGRAIEDRSPGQAVTIRGFTTEAEEVEAMAKLIEGWKEQGKLGDFAILFRKNTDAEHMIAMLRKRQIICKKEGSSIPSSHLEIIEDLTAYVKLIQGDVNRRNFLRILNRPDRGLDRGICVGEHICFDELKDFCRKEGDPKGMEEVEKLIRNCRMAAALDPFALMVYLRKGFSYEKHLRSKYRDKKEELALALEYLDYLQNLSKGVRTREELIERWMEERRLAAKPPVYESSHPLPSSGDPEIGLHILTYHGSKGLEYKNVLLPDLNEGIVPHNKARKEEEIEEERRLFYVGMTRAVDHLYLFYVKGTKEEPQTPSRFLRRLL